MKKNLVHAVPHDYARRVALCGARKPSSALPWQRWHAGEITCPRCVKSCSRRYDDLTLCKGNGCKARADGKTLMWHGPDGPLCMPCHDKIKGPHVSPSEALANIRKAAKLLGQMAEQIENPGKLRMEKP